jgi:serine protease Do
MKSLFERLRSRRLASVFVLLATLSVAIVAGSFAAHGVRGQEKQINSADATPLKVVNSPVPPNEFVKIARLVGPAVVNINTQTLPKQTENKGRRNPHGRTTPIPQNPDDEDQPDEPQQGQGGGQGGGQGNFQDFFNRFFGGQMPDQDGDDGQVRESLGSGFIVDPKGYIITNNHVIDKADKIYVKLSTDPDSSDLGRPAHVIGFDKATDLAVIKIDTNSPLPIVKMGNSDTAQVGDWVEAIGSPFALSQTVTAGIISAKNRTIEPGASGQFQHFIQTDAAINPGNSGGPLVDMAGQVIGMNTAIYTQSMGSQGVGFAMPSNVIVDVYNQLIGPEHKVVRGSIGISFQGNVSAAVSREYGFANGGVLVNSVTPGKGAAKAGIQFGDVIVSIDGKPIKDGDQLVADISARKVGSTVQLGYLRDGKQHTASVLIGDRSQLGEDASNAGGDNAAPAQSDAGEGKLGIKVDAVPASVASKLGIKGGVIVTSVRPGSFADEIGLERGFVITEINKRPVADDASYRTVVSGLKSGDDVAFAVRTPNGGASGPSLFGGTLP